MPVFRAPMRSRDDEVETWAGVERGLELGLCGIGGRLEEAPRDLDAALSATSDAYGSGAAARLARFAGAPTGSWVWTQEQPGAFRLGRIVGRWRFDATAEAARADLVHVRNCTWSPEAFAEHELPPAVAHTFRRGGRNFQRTHDPEVARLTERCWTTRVR